LSGVLDSPRFDSISALQWLCQADEKTHVPRKRLMRLFQTTYNSLRRGARAVFQFYPERPEHVTLITTCALRCGFTGGMVVDFPNSSKAKKFYLCLFAGSSVNSAPQALPPALGTGAVPADVDDDDNDDDNDDDDDDDGGGYGNRNDDDDDNVTVASAATGMSAISRAFNKNAASFAVVAPKKERRQRRGKRRNVKDVDWVLRKKERARAKGLDVARDSKFTGRRRKAAF
jgi:18S rRNA (guanine1575-N7)-methyltransferase